MHDQKTSIKEILRYLIAGFATTLVNWIFYTLCIVGLHLSITAANAVSWLIAVLFAFGINKTYVFQSKGKSGRLILKEIVSFFLARAATGVIEIFLPALLMQAGLNQALFGLRGSLAKGVTTVVVIVLNYVFSKYFVFTKKEVKTSL